MADQKKPVKPKAAKAPIVATVDKPHKSLDEAINWVMSQCGYVLKTGVTGTGSYAYSFASEVDLLNAIRGLMVAAGLTLRPVGMQVTFNERYLSSKGGSMFHSILSLKYKLSHWPSGQSDIVEVPGEAADSGDKTTPKCMTIGQKYALRQIFLLECGDDPDKVAGTDNEPLPPKTPLEDKKAAGTQNATTTSNGGNAASSAPKEDPFKATYLLQPQAVAKLSKMLSETEGIDRLEELWTKAQPVRGREKNYSPEQLAELKKTYDTRKAALSGGSGK